MTATIIDTAKRVIHKRTDYRTLLFACCLLFVEWFDFSSFYMLLSLLSVVLFPTNAAKNTTYLLAIFTIGQLCRPLGGMVFGFVGDRYSRRLSFLLSCGSLCGVSILFALLPSYKKMGFTGLFLLVLVRIVQAIAMSGFMNTLVLLTDNIRPKARIMSISVVNSIGGDRKSVV